MAEWKSWFLSVQVMSLNRTPSSSKVVSTTGTLAIRHCRTLVALDGKKLLSFTASQTSIDQPLGNGITSPRGSTTGSTAHSGFPTAVQFLCVTLIERPRCERGTKEELPGSYWRSAQNGITQSGRLWKTVKLSRPLASWMLFRGTSSAGRVLRSSPLIAFAALNIRKAIGGTLRRDASQSMTVCEIFTMVMSRDRLSRRKYGNTAFHCQLALAN